MYVFIYRERFSQHSSWLNECVNDLENQWLSITFTARKMNRKLLRKRQTNKQKHTYIDRKKN